MPRASHGVRDPSEPQTKMCENLKLPKPLDLTGNVAEKWKKWKESFEIYVIAAGLDEKSAKQKTGILLNVIGDEGVDLYKSFEMGDDAWDFKKVMDKFKEHCEGRKNTFRNREMLWKMRQREDQTIDQYLSELKLKIQECDIEDRNLKESLIKQRLIAGMKDEACKRRLIDREGDKLTLEDAVKAARNSEATEKEMRTLGFTKSTSAEKSPENVHAVRGTGRTQTRQPWRKPTPQRKQQPKSAETSSTQNTYMCGRCGNRHEPRRCPAINKTCAKCGGRNHFAVACRSKPRPRQNPRYNPRKPRVNYVEQKNELDENEQYVDECNDDDYENDQFFVGDNCCSVTETESEKIDVVNEENKPGWWIELLDLNGSSVPFKIDTGANVNILSVKDYRLIKNKPKINKPVSTLSAYGGGELKVVGRCIVTVCRKGQKYKIHMVVCDEDTQSIIGLGGIKILNLVQRVDVVTLNAKASVLDDYKDVFEGLGTLPGVHKIKLQREYVPVVEACRKIPFPLQGKVENELKRMESLGVIERVYEPTEWVNSMVIVHKANGKLRICLDPRNLNKYIQREHYAMPTRDEIHAKFADAKYFSKFDASQGFWQIQLDEESSKLCTFNTPLGRFKYNRLPFGISSAPEVFHRIVHELFNMPGVDTSMDDIIVFGKTKQEHDERVKKVLEKCRETGLKLNKEKCEIGKTEIVYLGDTLTDQGVKPDRSKVEAIGKMDRPTDKKGIQRFLGMVNFLGRYIPDLSNITEPLRNVMVSKNVFKWEAEQERAWNTLKQCLVEAPVLKYYDPKKEILISSDSSQNGIGCVLLQKEESDWHPVAYASRTMTQAERSYAQIEKETLCIVYAHERFHQYLYGRSYHVETDHKPLVSIFSKPLIDVPPRIQRMRMRLQKYDFHLSYTPGKYMYVADSLSRAHGNNEPKSSIETDVKVAVDAVIEHIQMSKSRLQEVAQETKKDSVMCKLINQIIRGWPEFRAECDSSLHPFWNYRDELSVIDGVVFKGNRVVVPVSLRNMMLKKIHQGHLGEIKCKNRARQVLFWPQMGHDIENVVRNCEACIKYRNKQQSEPMQPLPVTTRAWSRVSTDLFELKNKYYLVCVDSFSSYPEVEEISKQTSAQVIKTLKKIFSRHGIPDIVYSDNGPCYASDEFSKFSKEYEFQHVTSSPTYAQSNGHAERMVQTVKNIYKKCDETGEDRELGLLVYRSSPLECGKSPAELLFGRPIKSNLPMKLCNQNNEQTMQKKIQQKIKQKFYHDQNCKPLEVLQCGNSVRIRDNENNQWKEKAIVLQEVAPRSYLVKTERGGLFRRNRRDILKTNEFVDVESDEEEQKEQSEINQMPLNVTKQKERSENQPIMEAKKSYESDQNARKETKYNTEETKKVEPKKEKEPEVLRRSNRTRKKPNRLIEIK